MTIEIPRKYAPDTEFEALWLSCLELIRRGTTRDAYAIPEHDDKVLKVSNRQVNFQNWSEIILYQHKKDTCHLAKIFSWSKSGRFLVMEKLSPVDSDDMAGFIYPSYLTDRKPANYGKDSEGKIKALDYAMFGFAQDGHSMFS